MAHKIWWPAVLLLALGGLSAARADAQPAVPSPNTTSCSAPAMTLAAILDAGRALLDADRGNDASACFERAAGEAAARHLLDAEGAARLGLAQAYYGTSDYPRAQEEADRALAIFQRTGDALNAARATRVKGSAAMFRGDRILARRLHAAAAAEFERLGAHRDRAVALLALVNSSDDRVEQFAKLDEAIALARQAADRVTEARALHSRGDHHFTAGRFDQALDDLHAAIGRFEAAGTRGDLADAYVSVGRVLRAHGRFEEAIGYYDRAIAIQEESGDLRAVVQSLSAKAVAQGLLGRTAEARRDYERACEIARRTKSERIISFAEGNLAGVYAQEGNHPKAIELLEAVLTREREPYVLAYRHSTLSQSYAALGSIDRAREHAERAVEFARASDNRDYLPTVLQRQADIERRAGLPDEALAHAREAVTAVEDLRARLVPSDYMKRGFAERHQEVFGLTIALMLDRGRDADALVTSEQARARAFLDLLASRELTGRREGAGVPFTPRERRELPLASYATAAPASTSEIAAIAKRLRSTILSYWVTDDEVCIWVMSPSGHLRAARVAVGRTALEKTVAAATPAVKRGDHAAWSRLYGWLIDPVARWLPARGALTIVPHGPLFRVSFAALPDRRGTYLVERYEVSYAPSISTFTWTARLGQRATRADTRLLVADPQPAPQGEHADSLRRLSAAAEEIEAIRGILGRDGTVPLARTRASEAAVRSELAGKRIIHLATHAIVRDDAPFDSFLVLGATGAAPEVDGRLTVRELYGLSLDADLVVLSACRSAAGRASGDGIAGLSRAWFYAGTPSLVATLWDVADAPSATLIGDFYRAWRGGADKRAALRQAQLRTIKALRAGTAVVHTPEGDVQLSNQPFYWGAWIVLGEP